LLYLNLASFSSFLPIVACCNFQTPVNSFSVPDRSFVSFFQRGIRTCPNEHDNSICFRKEWTKRRNLWTLLQVCEDIYSLSFVASNKESTAKQTE
jgi:hypothetical protein